MGKAFKCDVCGTVETGEPAREITVRSGKERITVTQSGYVGRVYLDVCEDCAPVFDDWLMDFMGTLE